MSGENGSGRAPEPWEPDPKWHKARREAFVAYRDMAERSLSALARELHKSKQLLGKWSRQDGWVERCAAWDAERDRRLREEFLSSSSDVAREQAEDAAVLRGALLEPGRALVAKIKATHEAGRDPFAGLTVSEMVRLTSTAARAFSQVVAAERLAHGLSTENLAGADGGPLAPEVEAKSDAELEAFLLGVQHGAGRRADGSRAAEGAEA